MFRNAYPKTAELLLDLLELLGRETSDAQASCLALAPHHDPRELRRRVEAGITALQAEGLIESDPLVPGGYRATRAGHASLTQRLRPQGEATVMFSDLVDSTQLIGRFGELGAHELRQRHFALLREAIAAHQGREVKNLGDGLMVIFAHAPDAQRCAIAMQRTVNADADQLGLRIGLHSGELLREGDDFFGTTVIVARRLCEQARSGEILVSDATHSDDKRTSLGALTLKGLATPVGAARLCWAR